MLMQLSKKDVIRTKQSSRFLRSIFLNLIGFYLKVTDTARNGMQKLQREDYAILKAFRNQLENIFHPDPEKCLLEQESLLTRNLRAVWKLNMRSSPRKYRSKPE